MELIELFVSFTKVGFTSFGGMSMIPLIQDEMFAHHWMSAQDFMNIIAIAEMTPGPFGLNCATFAGMQVAGVVGGIAAVMGVLSPAYTLTMIVAVMFTRLKGNSVFENILFVIRPICIGMLISVIVSLCVSNYFPGGQVNGCGIGIGALMFYLMVRWKWSVPWVILLSGFLGLICYGVLGIG